MDARQPGCLPEQATAERSLGASRKDRSPRGPAQPTGIASVGAAVPLRAGWWSPAGRLPGPCGLRAGGARDGRAAGALPGLAGAEAAGGGAGEEEYRRGRLSWLQSLLILKVAQGERSEAAWVDYAGKVSVLRLRRAVEDARAASEWPCLPPPIAGGE